MHLLSVVRVSWKNRRYCGGDFKRFDQTCYETVANVVNRTDVDIVGHINLTSN